MSSDLPQQRPNAWFSGRQIAIALTLGCIPIIGAYAAFEVVQKWMRRRETSNNFKQLGMALHNFHDTYGSLPYPVRRTGGGDGPHGGKRSHDGDEQDPEGEPLYSWRFAIARFVSSYSRLETAYDQPWDSPLHTGWRMTWQPYSYDGYDETSRFKPMTNVLAITGPGTAFGDGKEHKPHYLHEIDADTILLVEVANSGIHWMEPGDFDIRTMPQTIGDPAGRGISSRYGDGFHVLFADGSVDYLSNQVPFSELKKFFTVEGAKQYDRRTVLKPYSLL